MPSGHGASVRQKVGQIVQNGGEEDILDHKPFRNRNLVGRKIENSSYPCVHQNLDDTLGLVGGVAIKAISIFRSFATSLIRLM